MRSTIEIFQNGAWIAAAEFEPLGDGPYAATFEYKIDYVFGIEKPQPLSFAFPVNAERRGLDSAGAAQPCPAFLLDLVPQGRGRTYLAQVLAIDEGEHNDLRLAQYGAFNPIGNLRLDTAVAFYRDHLPAEPVSAGFTLEALRDRQEDFLEHIWRHAMLSAGTTGVQGAAPKFLLTQDHEGLWFADAALEDKLAAKHWLVKLPRGSHSTDDAVLRNEAAYLRVAERCGLRTGGEPRLYGDMLFVPRFDRQTHAGGVVRLHQESVASLAGVHGFGKSLSLFDQVEAFRPYVTDPTREIIEFIRRDILNLAMRNTDNHARNTAVQRLPDGTVQLTPLFDFAPMYLDREMIVRGSKWRTASGRELTDWEDIFPQFNLRGAEQQTVAAGVKAFQVVIEHLEDTLRDCGVDAFVINDCMPSIETQVARLDRISSPAPTDLKEDGHGPTP